MLHTPNITHTMLPNLLYFSFGGVSGYLEALLSHMIAPLLEKLKVYFFNQLSYTIPNLRQLVMTTENFRSSSVNCLFYHKAVSVFNNVSASPWSPGTSPTLDIRVDCEHLDWQVSSITQILNVLSPLFSATVDLTLDYRSHTLSSEWHNQADRAQWRELLGSFRNVETLRVHDGLVGELSRCLALDGESASEILPELKILVCPTGSRDEKTFAKFAHDREVAGLPIELIEEDFPAGEFEYDIVTQAGEESVPM
jgi:hypothetical protein